MFLLCKNLALSLIVCLISFSAFTADVTVTVNGKVIAKPCTIVTSDMNIDIGDLFTFNLVSPGSSSEWHDFNLKLSNCPVGTSRVKATFSGSADSSGYYRNSGTAGNIQIQLQDDAGMDLKNGSSKEVSVKDSDKSADLPLKVRVLSVQGNATQGTIQGIIDVIYTYA